MLCVSRERVVDWASRELGILIRPYSRRWLGIMIMITRQINCGLKGSKGNMGGWVQFAMGVGRSMLLGFGEESRVVGMSWLRVLVM